MERTGFPQRTIAEHLMEPNRVLNAAMVRGIERHNQMPTGAYQHFVGRSLRELLDGIAYSQAPVPTNGGRALITTAFVSALAGTLLLAEAIKESVPALAPYQLNREYRQDLLGISNHDHYWSRPDTSGYCLCADPLRRRLYKDKYGNGGVSVPA